MAWLAPFWLWALPTAALPVLVHLVLRPRRRRVVLPSLLFLARAAPRLEARRRLRERIVLAMRCLALAAAVLALARPVVSGLGAGGAGAVVVVIDNSASLAAAGADGAPRLRQGVAAAAALLADLDPDDAAAVIAAVPEPDAPDPETPVRVRERTRAALDRIAASDAAAAPAAVLRRAATLLATSGGRRELHLFTDAQAHEWGVPGDPPALPPGVDVTVHRLPPPPSGAAPAITALALPPRALLAGRPLPVRVAVANPGAAAAEVRLTVEDDGGGSAQAATALAAGGATDLVLVLPAPAAGEHWLRARLEGGVAGAAYAVCRIEPRRAVRMLGRRAWYGALPAAIDPDGDGALSGLQVEEVAAGRWDLACVGDPALVVATWDQLPGDAVADRLRAWLRAGGRLLALPRAGAASGGPLPSWLGVTAGTLAASGESLLALDPDHPLWRDLRGADGRISLDARLGAGWRLSGGHGVLGTASGATLLAAAAHGRGIAWVWGSAADLAAGDLPRSPAFVVIAQALAAPVSSEVPSQHWAGDPLAPGLTGAVAVQAVAGPLPAWSGEAAALAPPPRAGVVRLRHAGGASLLAVSADPGEADPLRVEGDRLPALGALPHRVEDWPGPESMLARRRARLHGRDLLPWLLALLVAALAIETWLANRIPASGRDGGRR